MKRKIRMNKVVILLLITLAFILNIFSQTKAVEASPSPKSIVASSLKYMKKFKAISYTYSDSWDNGLSLTRTGMATSSASIVHGFYLYFASGPYAWEFYQKKNKYYKKELGENSWSSSNMYYDSTDFDCYTDKRQLEYILAHLKDIRITSESTSSYKLTAKPSVKIGINKVILVIAKKNKSLTSATVYQKTDTGSYHVEKWKNISYCSTGISMPDAL